MFTALASQDHSVNPNDRLDAPVPVTRESPAQAELQTAPSAEEQQALPVVQERQALPVVQEQQALPVVQEQQALPVVQGKSRWLISRWFDLLFICGGAPWIVGAIAQAIFGWADLHPAPLVVTTANPQPQLPTGTPEQQAFSTLFVIASLLIGESHQFTSIIRYYTSFRRRSKPYRWNRVPFWAMYAGLATVAAIVFFQAPLGSSWWGTSLGAVATTLFILFPTILMQHVCAQAKAIGMMYCGRSGYKLSGAEQFGLSLTTLLVALAGAATIASPFGLEQLEEVPAVITVRACLIMAGQTAALLYALHVLRRGLKRKEWLPAGAAIMWTNLAMWALLPVDQLLYVLLSVPLLFHATQHWAVAWVTRRTELQATGAVLTPVKSLRAFVQMVLPIQAMTMVVLFLPLLLNRSNQPTPFNETLTVEWSILVFFFHYFADRIVWRPR